MTTIVRALLAEALKMRRTLALKLAFLAPLILVGFMFVAFLDDGEQFTQSPLTNAWIELAQVIHIFWALLLLPLFVTLQTALLAQLEHGSGQWKHLYVLPLPRWAVYAAKQIAALVLMAVSHLALVGFSLVAGVLLWGLRPGLGFHASIPWGRFLGPVVATYLASWLIVAIHTWVALRWRSFVAAMAIGIVLTVAGMVAINTELGRLYPWALAGMIVNGFNKGEPLEPARLAFGTLGGMLVALWGCWRVTRRDVC